MLLGYAIRKSRICFVGLLRDVYLLGYRYNIILFGSIICTVGLTYYLLAVTGLIRIPSLLPPFSLFSVAVGAFSFGFGATMSSGCLTATLIKCGDGRVSGWIYLFVFIATAYFFAAGPGISLSKVARSQLIVNDDIGIRTTTAAVYIFAVFLLLLFVIMLRNYRAHKKHISAKTNQSGIKYLIFEKDWPMELGPIVIGIILGLAFYFSDNIGRHFGVAISTPVMSWIYLFTNPTETCGGCNPFDEKFGWGSMLVLGIIIGSFITSVLSREFKIIMVNKKELARGIIGAALMGFGAMWGLGCLLSNGLVGTAQLSMKSWYALLFMTAGIWSATRIIYIPMLKS